MKKERWTKQTKSRRIYSSSTRNVAATKLSPNLSYSRKTVERKIDRGAGGWSCSLELRRRVVTKRLTGILLRRIASCYYDYGCCITPFSDRIALYRVQPATQFNVSRIVATVCHDPRVTGSRFSIFRGINASKRDPNATCFQTVFNAVENLEGMIKASFRNVLFPPREFSACCKFPESCLLINRAGEICRPIRLFARVFKTFFSYFLPLFCINFIPRGWRSSTSLALGPWIPFSPFSILVPTAMRDKTGDSRNPRRYTRTLYRATRLRSPPLDKGKFGITRLYNRGEGSFGAVQVGD